MAGKNLRKSRKRHPGDSRLQAAKALPAMLT
jgi:hypothetical protein